MVIWLCCLYYGLDFWFTVGVVFGSGCCLVAGCFDFAVLLLIVGWRLFVLCVVWLDCWVSACCFGLGLPYAGYVYVAFGFACV